MTGEGVKPAATMEMQMADCAPTILAMAGCPIPDDVEGRVLTEAFDAPPQVHKESAAGDGQRREGDDAYSAEELAKVTERLADLGYLE